MRPLESQKLDMEGVKDTFTVNVGNGSTANGVDSLSDRLLDMLCFPTPAATPEVEVILLFSMQHGSANFDLNCFQLFWGFTDQ